MDGLEIREVDDGFMVHHARESRLHYLNHTAVVVLELCDGRRTVEDIAKRVAKAFGLPAPPRREVDDILAQMTAQGLVVRPPARRPSRRGPAAEKLRRFPHLLWINLDREQSRRRYMEKQLAAYAVPHTRIPAYDGSAQDLTRYLTHRDDRCSLSPQEVGATISHLKAVRHFLDYLDAEHVVIAEDDVDLSPCRFWGFDWDYVMAHLPFDWDVVQLAIICRPDYLVTRIHPRRAHDWSAACYLLSRRHALKLMALHERDGLYKIDNGVLPKPVAEQVIFLSGKTYSMPLFLYRLEFQSAIHQEDVEDVHAECRRAVLDWWSKGSVHVGPEALFRLEAPPWPEEERQEAPRRGP